MKAISDLYQFPVYQNREVYQRVKGQQAPPWDPSRPIQRFDCTPGEYLVFDGAGKFSKVTIATGLNLPGVYVYPRRVVAPTTATILSPWFPDPVPVNPDLLCSESEVREICATTGWTYAEAPVWIGGAFHWGAETRRVYNITLPDGSTHDASVLVRQRTAAGIGSPGRWVVEGGVPRWISTVPDTGERDPRPEVPIPCRPLESGEVLVSIPTPFGAQWMVDTPAPAAPATGGLTAEQDRLLRAIAARMGVA